jgi:catechol 2,3-dioxygenase-like lactoylglutathione lyase family enzyme
VSSWATGIATVTLFVDDLEATKEFYRETFGLPVMFEDDDSAVFRFGATLVNLLDVAAATELVEPAPVAASAAGARAVMTVEVPDVDAVCAVLAQRGMVLLNGPVDRPWGVRTAAFADPAGHVWEVAAPLAL